MTQETLNFPKWIINLANRLFKLKPGRYQLLLTIGPDHCDCTIQELGKVENLGR